MEDLSFIKPAGLPVKKNIESILLGVILVLACVTVQNLLSKLGDQIGVVDPNIWLLIVISLLCFLIVVAMSWWVLKWTWRAMGLPKINVMVLQFRDLEIWQQLGFFFASFALLLSAGIVVLVAIL